MSVRRSYPAKNEIKRGLRAGKSGIKIIARIEPQKLDRRNPVAKTESYKTGLSNFCPQQIPISLYEIGIHVAWTEGEKHAPVIHTACMEGEEHFPMIDNIQMEGGNRVPSTGYLMIHELGMCTL